MPWNAPIGHVKLGIELSMRLKSLKLVGFKSFVDSTLIPFPTNLTAIVGPNGCGKSNIVDAIKWVLGETRAKDLRGESMTDVIFNGSSGRDGSPSRKPVGQASAELVFENNDGKLQGEYAKYAEIALKRQVDRDGQSQYFLNGTRCRRKDIQDVFLGTGLGTRNSYSIIEQGMISRFIEAKPDDLRLFIEEAAGVSRYKERRRETETRIRHTRENLERLEDLRQEVVKQIENLQRQARSAEKYKLLKQEERLSKAQLLALHWQDMDTQINSHDLIIKEKQVKVEERIAEQRSIDRRIESDRQKQTELGDVFNEVQGRYYAVGAEIARLEQSIQHHRERQQQLKMDQQQVEQAWRELTEHLETDQQNIARWTQELVEFEPALETVKAEAAASSDILENAEQTMTQWQTQWDEFNHQASKTSQLASVERTRVQHLQEQIDRNQHRLSVLELEQVEIEPQAFDAKIAELETQQAALAEQVIAEQAAIQQGKDELRELRQQQMALNDQLNERRSETQKLRGRQAALQALQQASVGTGKGSASAWLETQQLQDNARLAQHLQIQAGWELAVETVLGSYLEAVCVDDITKHADFAGLQRGQVLLFDKQQHAASAAPGETWLANHVQSTFDLSQLLSGIYCAESWEDAVALRQRLQGNQSVVTKDGIWLGSSWIRIAKIDDKQGSVLAREQELKSNIERLEQYETELKEIASQLTQTQENLKNLDLAVESRQQNLNQTQQKLANVKAQCLAEQQNRQRVQQRAAQVAKDLLEIRTHLESCVENLTEAKRNSEAATAQMEKDVGDRETLSAARGSYRGALDHARDKAKADQAAVHQLTLKTQNLSTQLQATRSNIGRIEEQLHNITQRRDSLNEAMKDESPLFALEQELQEKLELRVLADQELQESRYQLETLTHQLQTLEQDRQSVIEQVEALRDALQQSKLDFQTLNVRRSTYAEQILEMQFELEQLIAEMPPEANIQAWEEELQAIGGRIQRLGAINLAAIDELKIQEERQVYLDAQFTDLTEALNTLETAIRKIDKETKDLFQETFDKINEGFKNLFPQVFGGGRASLELSGEDILETGVMVMAQPPGKRNSSIHLLSGGEKALTAISLVFAIFQLNPAPFCLLDEVDAPLDDANVGRYCNLVKEMSKQVQFMFISHNKVAMEMAEQLMGVTMHEPGVSRIVAVDVKEAVDMVAV